MCDECNHNARKQTTGGQQLTVAIISSGAGTVDVRLWGWSKAARRTRHFRFTPESRQNSRHSDVSEASESNYSDRLVADLLFLKYRPSSICLRYWSASLTASIEVS